jgi:hypothetical protein
VRRLVVARIHMLLVLGSRREGWKVRGTRVLEIGGVEWASRVLKGNRAIVQELSRWHCSGGLGDQ